VGVRPEAPCFRYHCDWSVYRRQISEEIPLKITVGIITTQKRTAETLAAQIHRTGVATIVAEVSDDKSTTLSARQVINADPEIIIVDVNDFETSLQTLQFLHTTAPSARLLVTSNNTDPQLMIELMRAGVREFLPSPVSEQALVQAFDRYSSEKALTTTRQKTRAKRGKVYCIASAKHGSGATTVAINLAGIIAARSKRKTALIDLDRPLGDVAAYLNVKPNFTLSDALAAGPRLDSVLLESYMQPTHGFHILPGFPEHSADASLSADKLSQLLEVAQGTFDYTIVDLPTNLDEDQVKMIARVSSAILVILTPELPAIWRTERLLSYLVRLEAAAKVRIVLNRATRSDDINDSDIERLLRMPLYCKLPNEYGACIRAINSGTVLNSVNCKYLSKAISALAAELAGFTETEARRSLFGITLKPSIGGTNA
jgi:pilus assembly protein CpaE